MIAASDELKQAAMNNGVFPCRFRNIQMTRITGLGMQDGLKAGMNQPVVHPLDGNRNGRNPKRLEVILPSGPLVVQYSAA